MLQVSTFKQLLSEASERFRGQPFLIDDERLGTVSYIDVFNFANGVNHHFDSLGIPVGASVATILHNSGMAALLFLAVIASRRMLVPLNPNATTNELEYMLDRAKCVAVMVDSDYTKSADGLSRNFLRIADHREYFVEHGSNPKDAEIQSADSAPDDTFVGEVVFTSGSTGQPKGVVLSEQNLLANAASLARVYDLGSNDRFLTVCPLFHNSGQVLTTLTCALVGGSTAAIKSDVGMLNFWHYVDKYRANWSLGMVSFLALLLTRKENPRQPSSMLSLLTGGSAIDGALIKRFESRFGVPVRTVYGLTETSSISTCEFRDPSPRSLGSSGRALPTCNVRIGDSVEKFAAPDQPESRKRGEIWIEGPNVFDHYIADEELTRIRKHGSWLRTGDLGYFDENHNLFVVDRLDSMLIVGGENVYPAEVEKFCASLPGAAQIVLAGVVHPIWGKQLVLVYKSESGVIPSIGTWHRVLVDRVATFKIPQRYVAIQDLGLDEFPRKENGKLDRRTIETLLIQHQSATD